MTEIEEYLGRDIDIRTGDIHFTSNNNFRFVSGYDNLTQAIKTRFSSSKGIFSDFPEYGGNLGKFLGDINSIFTINKLKQELYEICMQEPRIEKVESIDIKKINDTTLRFDIKVIAINSNNSQNLVWDYFINF